MLPTLMWHTVHMAQAAVALSSPLLSTLRIDVDSVERGVSLSTMADFMKRSGVELKDLYDIVIPARTLQHLRVRCNTGAFAARLSRAMSRTSSHA